MSTTTIREPSGATYKVESRNDALVHAKLNNSVSITVDNRGKPSTLDELIKLYFMQWQAEQVKESD
jgi:hypothetical protein